MWAILKEAKIHKELQCQMKNKNNKATGSSETSVYTSSGVHYVTFQQTSPCGTCGYRQVPHSNTYM